MPKEPMKFQEMLKDSPKNWGRWGANDELGCLNFLTNQEVLRGAKAVRQGKTFTLGVPLARPQHAHVTAGRIRRPPRSGRACSPCRAR